MWQISWLKRRKTNKYSVTCFAFLLLKTFLFVFYRLSVGVCVGPLPLFFTGNYQHMSQFSQWAKSVVVSDPSQHVNKQSLYGAAQVQFLFFLMFLIWRQKGLARSWIAISIENSPRTTWTLKRVVSGPSVMNVCTSKRKHSQNGSIPSSARTKSRFACLISCSRSALSNPFASRHMWRMNI